MDAAHRATDKELERIEKKLTEIYKQASKELGEKADKYFERFKVLDRQKRILVDSGKMSEADYKKWRHGKIMTGEHWKQMQKQAAQRLTEADRIAAEYTNGRLPYVYALNYNSVAEGLETGLMGYSFDLVDEATVRNLAESDKTLLPYKTVDGKKAERWHTARVNAEVTQGILQGESIPKIAKRLKTNVGMVAKGSAVRNARTSVTSAENKGRIDMLHDARKKGVIADKIWMAAHDSRTREAHLDLDGQQVPEDEMFKSVLGEIEYPGDPSAAPANTYNCRCSLGYKVVGFEAKKEETYYKEYEIFNSETFNEEQRAEINTTFRSLDAKYHARIDGITSTLQREQQEWDTHFRNYVESLMEKNPTMRKKTAEKKAIELLGERPQNVSIFLGGDYNYESGIMTLNTHGVGMSGTLSEDIIHRKNRIRRNERKLEQGMQIYPIGNVGSTATATFLHEYGHAIDATYGVTKNPAFLEYYERMEKEQIAFGVSDYASTNAEEFFAEAFCESFMGETQGSVSKDVMNVLEKIIRGKRR